MNKNPLKPEREGRTHDVQIGEHKLYITTGEYEDGTLGEVFIKLDKMGAELRVYDVLATIISVAIQNGVPLGTIIGKLKHQQMEPRGITSNTEIPVAKSVAEYIGRWLEAHYG